MLDLSSFVSPGLNPNSSSLSSLTKPIPLDSTDPRPPSIASTAHLTPTSLNPIQIERLSNSRSEIRSKNPTDTNNTAAAASIITTSQPATASSASSSSSSSASSSQHFNPLQPDLYPTRSLLSPASGASKSPDSRPSSPELDELRACNPDYLFSSHPNLARSSSPFDLKTVHRTTLPNSLSPQSLMSSSSSSSATYSHTHRQVDPPDRVTAGSAPALDHHPLPSPLSQPSSTHSTLNTTATNLTHPTRLGSGAFVQNPFSSASSSSSGSSSELAFHPTPKHHPPTLATPAPLHSHPPTGLSLSGFQPTPPRASYLNHLNEDQLRHQPHSNIPLLGHPALGSSLPTQSPLHEPFGLPIHSQMLNHHPPQPPTHPNLFGYPRPSPSVFHHGPPHHHHHHHHHLAVSNAFPNHPPSIDQFDYRPNSNNSWQALSINPVSDSYQPAFYDPFQIKHRRRTTPAQLHVLEAQFESNCKPDVVLRKKLAEQLDMTPREVQVWFQNRRAKTKKLEKRAELDGSGKTSSENLAEHSDDQSLSNAPLSARSGRTSISPQSSIFYPSNGHVPNSHSTTSVNSGNDSHEDYRLVSSNQNLDPARPSSTNVPVEFFTPPHLHEPSPTPNGHLGRPSFLANDTESYGPHDEQLGEPELHLAAVDRHLGSTAASQHGLYQPVHLYPLQPPSFVFGTAPGPQGLTTIPGSLGSVMQDKKPTSDISLDSLGEGYDFKNPRGSLASSIATTDSHQDRPDSMDNFMTPTSTDFSFDANSQAGMMSAGDGSLYPLGFDPRRRASCPAEFIQSFGHFGGFMAMSNGVSQNHAPLTNSQTPFLTSSSSASQPAAWIHPPTQPGWSVEDDMSEGLMGEQSDSLEPSLCAPSYPLNGPGAIQRRHSVASIITYGQPNQALKSAMAHPMGSHGSPQHLSPHLKQSGVTSAPSFTLPPHMMAAYGRRASTSSVGVLNAIEEHPGHLGPGPMSGSRSAGSDTQLDEFDENADPLNGFSSPSDQARRRPQLDRRARSQANMKTASGYQLMKPKPVSPSLRRSSIGPSSSLEAMFNLSTHDEHEGQG